MFNREMILAKKVNRLKWYMETDKLDHYQKQVFIKGLILEIMSYYYGGKFPAFYQFTLYVIKDTYMWTKIRINYFYCKHILKLTPDEFDARTLGFTTEEIKELKNADN